MRRPSRPRVALTVLAAGCAFLAACSTAASGAAGSGGGSVIQVVAAENFWGSIASQIGGRHVHVVSIITNPDTDPHSYEPTAADARTIRIGKPGSGPDEPGDGEGSTSWAPGRSGPAACQVPFTSAKVPAVPGRAQLPPRRAIPEGVNDAAVRVCSAQCRPAGVAARIRRLIRTPGRTRRLAPRDVHQPDCPAGRQHHGFHRQGAARLECAVGACPRSSCPRPASWPWPGWAAGCPRLASLGSAGRCGTGPVPRSRRSGRLRPTTRRRSCTRG